MLSISALLCEPNPNDPLVGNIAAQLRKNKAQHDQIAKDHTNQ
jgi:ubiquitin-protein ligase